MEAFALLALIIAVALLLTYGISYLGAWLIIDVAGIAVFGLATWQLAVVFFAIVLVARQFTGD